MNDIEKSIEKLRSANSYHTQSQYNLDDETIDMAISAIEKQTPKPPINKVHKKYKTLGENHFCACGVMFIDFERNGTNFCWNCGQRLKE